MADKILIVDDDPAICKLLEKVMHSNEMETSTVNCINVFGTLCFRDTDGITATCNCIFQIQHNRIRFINIRIFDQTWFLCVQEHHGSS